MGKIQASPPPSNVTEPIPTTNEPKVLDLAKSNGNITDRVRKKSWYNVIYPSYKSRSQTFKKLFKDVPNDERLIVGKFSHSIEEK